MMRSPVDTRGPKNRAIGRRSRHRNLFVICVAAFLCVPIGTEALRTLQTRHLFRQPRNCGGEATFRDAEPGWRIDNVISKARRIWTGPLPEDVWILEFHSPRTDDAKLRHCCESFSNVELVLLEDTRVSDEGMRSLASLSKLRELSLSDSRITSRGVEFLQDLENLEELELDGTDVDDDALRVLGKIKSLERLCLYETNITETGVAYLAKLPHLRSLALPDALGGSLMNEQVQMRLAAASNLVSVGDDVE